MTALAGHDGRHALMYSASDSRRVLSWTDGDPLVDPAPTG